MPRKKVKGHKPFDMEIFMRVYGWAQWEYESEDPNNPTLWWNCECMTFGRANDQFFYGDVNDWEQMDAFFEKYPEASITGAAHGGTGKGYIIVHTRLTAPWPTSFDEAFDLMVRWECGEAEEEREQIRHNYEQAMNGPVLLAPWMHPKREPIRPCVETGEQTDAAGTLPDGSQVAEDDDIPF